MTFVTGSSADIQDRIIKVIPKKWFSWVAPGRDAIIGALSDPSAWCYNWIQYARAQSRLATSYGIWLDIFSYDYLGRFLPRGGMSDGVYKVLIKATILQERVTRAGMVSALTTLNGTVPKIFEPWNTGDTGAYSSASPTGFKCGQFGYGVGNGGYGNMRLPAQAFIDIKRGANSGIPGVGGYTNNVAGWGVGKLEYAGSVLALTGITNSIIYKLIANTKPTGAIMWTRIGATAIPARRAAIFGGPDAKLNSQNIAVIL